MTQNASKSFQQPPGTQDVPDGVYGKYVTKKGGIKFHQLEAPGSIPLNHHVFSHGIIVMMTPAEFLQLADGTEMERNDTEETFLSIKNGIEEGSFFSPPYLMVDFESDPVRVVGHKGRHRCAVFDDVLHSKEMIPVNIFPHGMDENALQQFTPTREHLEKLAGKIENHGGKVINPELREFYTAGVNEVVVPPKKGWFGRKSSGTPPAPPTHDSD